MREIIGRCQNTEVSGAAASNSVYTVRAATVLERILKPMVLKPLRTGPTCGGRQKKQTEQKDNKQGDKPGRNLSVLIREPATRPNVSDMCAASWRQKPEQAVTKPVQACGHGVEENQTFENC